MNKPLGIFGAVAGLLSAILLTSGVPSFGGVLKPGCSAPVRASDTRVLSWRGDTSVEIRIPGAVQFEVAPKWRVVAAGPAAILEHLQFNNGRLEFDQSMNLCGADLKITLSGPGVRQWTLAGSGNLNLDGLRLTDLDLMIQGSGSATAAGTAEHTAVTISGSGDARLGGLKVKEAFVEIRGAGNVAIAPENSADIQIHGSGNVQLLKQPRTIQKWIRGSGNISGTG